MNKSIVVIIIFVLFFSIRYFVQKNQEPEPISYERVQADLDNIKNSHKYR